MTDVVVVINIGSKTDADLVQYKRTVYWDAVLKIWCDSFMDTPLPELDVVFWCLVPTLPVDLY